MTKGALFAFLFVSIQLAAQTGPALAVDVSASRHPISPDIYGVNDYQGPEQSLAAAMRIPVRRFGGDATTRYNWKLDAGNSAGDYFFEGVAYNDGANPLDLPNGSYFDQLLAVNHKTGTKTIGTIPMVGWTPKSRSLVCSFSVAKYGPQYKTDPYNPDCGNGQVNAQGDWLIGTDPHDANTPINPGFYADWIQHLIQTYGPANQGGVQIWSLDNEPEWWMGVHHDIHPIPANYDELTSLGIEYAQMIKAADPTALVSGPIPSGWDGYFYSAKDFVSGWSTAPYVYNDNPIDRNAHNGVPWLDWYLQQMKAYEAQHGQRLLDYLDVHAYVAPNQIAFGEPTDDATTKLRLTSTRAFWDPNYLVPDVDPTTPIWLVPRLHKWVNDNYPGTKTAITEYNWGALDDITGALAQADILGIFGREALDLATLWGPPTPGQPGVYAFEMFTNYDGRGSAFGDTSVDATTADPDSLPIYAAQRSDRTLTVVVINKTTGTLSSAIPIQNFQAAGTAHVYRYSGSASGIQALPDAAVSPQGFGATQFPAYSITLFEIPAQPSAAKPVVNAVVNAASYQAGIAPGEMVTLFGTNLGPAQSQNLALDSNGLLSNSVGGVSILFDGKPAPIIYVSSTQCAAMVPYFVGNLAMAQVQVEYQGNRSTPLSVPVVAASVGIYTQNQQGTGQASILNQDGVTANGPLKPAARGSVVSLFITGEGQTNPPGFDGKLATNILPKPMTAVSATIGGLDAEVTYAGAAPGNVAGFAQVNVRVPESVTPGVAVPVKLKIGDSSTGAATMAVQ